MPAPVPVAPSPTIAEPAGSAVGAPDTADLWERVRALVAASPSQSGLVELFELKSVRGDTAEVVVADASKAVFARTKVEWVGGLLTKALGRTMHARLIDAPAPEAAARDSADTPTRSAGASLIAADAAARAEAMENPLVRKAMDLFNARVISVENDTEA